MLLSRKVTTWDTTDECFTAADVASTEAESRSASSVFPAETDRSRTWIDTFNQHPESALGIPRYLVIGIYSDSSLVMTNRTVGKKAKKANAAHLLLETHWGWSAILGLKSGTTCAQIAQSLPTHPDDIVKRDVTIVVCVLSGTAKEGQHFSETSTTAGDVRQLCCRVI